MSPFLLNLHSSTALYRIDPRRVSLSIFVLYDIPFLVLSIQAEETKHKGACPSTAAYCCSDCCEYFDEFIRGEWIYRCNWPRNEEERWLPTEWGVSRGASSDYIRGVNASYWGATTVKINEELDNLQLRHYRPVTVGAAIFPCVWQGAQHGEREGWESRGGACRDS